MRDDRWMPTPPSVRPPQQERTRESWQRVLDVGLELLTTGGWDALTVSEVCRRCGISAPSLYARVDGRAGLFFAVYDYGIAQVAETQRRLAVPGPPGDLASAVAGAAHGILTTFEEHAGFLRAVILRASVDPMLRERGRDLSAWAIREATQHVPGLPAAVYSAGRMMFAECVVRIIYGDDFFTEGPEPASVFLERLASTATAAIRLAEQGSSPEG
jgi:AcrR family transcriptional regulator